MPVQRYVFINPDTVSAIEYTVENADEVFAAFPDALWCDDDNTPYFADDNGNYTNVEPGMMVLQFHDGSLMVMPKQEFHDLYEVVREEDPDARASTPE